MAKSGYAADPLMVGPARDECLRHSWPPEVASSGTSISERKRPNSPESTYRIILKPDAFLMDHGWYRLHRGTMGHGYDAMARTPGRVVRL